MKQLIVIVISILLSSYLFAQPFRYTETIFEKSDTMKNVEYATAKWLNNKVLLLAEYNIHAGENITESRPLYMDIFMPSEDTLTKRPVIIFAHSGGFLIGSNQNDDMIAFCDSFARRGFVTATLSYRLGMGADISYFLGFPVKATLSDKNAARAGYRATQDSRAAIRFLKHNAENYGIDTTKIYLVGSSAGAFMALHNMYMNNGSKIPDFVLENPSLGNLDTVGIQGYGGKANAIVSMWGALEKPELIEDEKSPVFLIHGENDDIVYFKKGMPLESLVPDLDIFEFSISETYGSYCIDTALNNRQVLHETYFVPDKKHEFYGVATGMFGDDGPNEYWDTIQNKIGDFLLDIFQPTTNFNLQQNSMIVNFTNSSSTNYYTKWDFGDNSTSEETNPTHTYNFAGNYKVKLTTCNRNMACDTFTKSVVIAPVSVYADWQNSVRIYPNPVSNLINIEGVTQPYNVTIYDLSGRAKIILKNNNKNIIAVNSLKQGFYILVVEKNDIKIYRKFFKQN